MKSNLNFLLFLTLAVALEAADVDGVLHLIDVAYQEEQEPQLHFPNLGGLRLLNE